MEGEIVFYNRDNIVNFMSIKVNGTDILKNERFHIARKQL